MKSSPRSWTNRRTVFSFALGVATGAAVVSFFPVAVAESEPSAPSVVEQREESSVILEGDATIEVAVDDKQVTCTARADGLSDAGSPYLTIDIEVESVRCPGSGITQVVRDVLLQRESYSTLRLEVVRDEQKRAERNLSDRLVIFDSRMRSSPMHLMSTESTTRVRAELQSYQWEFGHPQTTIDRVGDRMTIDVALKRVED